MSRGPFQPSRMLAARLRRGFTVNTLAEAMGLDRRTISRHDAGLLAPSAKHLRAAARALRFPERFFLGSDIGVLAPEAASFRWSSKQTARQRDMALGSAAVAGAIASPLMQPSASGRWVGIRIVTFEACSGFTRVTAHRIAQPPKATFVARLRPGRLPDQTARQFPDLSTIVRVRPSLTDDSRLRGALPGADIVSPNMLDGIVPAVRRISSYLLSRERSQHIAGSRHPSE